MRVPYRAAVRRGDKLVYEDCIVWIDEMPPEYRRGQNRKMKSRKYKLLHQQKPVAEKPSRRHAAGRRDRHED